MTVFPGGTSVSRLRVYDTAAPDGLVGGSPHMHTVSTEAYIVTAGRGALQTLDRTGFAEHSLQPGSVLWFGAGTIHRALNHGGLEVTVLMSNRGLPEAGDAVMTFGRDVMVDAARYRATALLPDAAVDRAAASTAARARRDAAVQGFGMLRDAAVTGDFGPLEEFYARALEVVGPRSADWAALREASVVADAAAGTALLAAVYAGSADLLGVAGPRAISAEPGEPRFGMCGMLHTYAVG